MQNAVIVYLSRQQDINILYYSLYFLYKNFNLEFKYPVIIYHDDITSVSISKLLVALYTSLNMMPNIKFEKIKFEIPANINLENNFEPPLSMFRLGYRHMCRWFSGEMYKHETLKNYDWYLRLDSDSFLLSKIKYDIFDHMKSNNYIYGYMSEYDKDEEFVVKDLLKATQEYLKINNILNEKINNWNLQIFYTNFEVGNLSFFKNNQYMSYYNYIDNTGNIYYKRWGDAPIRWFGVNMFLKDENILCIKDIAYQHGSWCKNLDYIDNESLNQVPQPYKNMIKI
jgi:hypothetical protein